MLSKCLLIVFVTLFYTINGHPTLDGRIVGGTFVNISSCPYQLSLQKNGSHVCGASILSRRNGITAAHCVEGLSISRISVYAGSNFYNTGGIRITITAVISHPNYNDVTSDFDIAIIEFSSDITFNSKILPVALPIENQAISSGTKAFISGWGYTKEESDIVSPALIKTEISVIGRLRCQRLYRGKGIITSRMMCAGKLDGGRDACQGDSGGPLIVNGVLVGVVSWGYGCARPNYPGVYTRIPKFVSWIKRNAKYL